MPTAIAVDYPLTPDDPLTAFPNGTDFGDGLFEACDIPPGWSAEVVTPPAYGAVVFQPDNTNWNYAANRPLPAANVDDTFTYRLTDGTAVSNVATVSLTLVVEV